MIDLGGPWACLGLPSIGRPRHRGTHGHAQLKHKTEYTRPSKKRMRPVGQAELGARAEIKNLNSFRFLEEAIQYEVRRQIELIEDGGTVVQETRLYDPDKRETRSMRSKEDAHDYRYFRTRI